MPELAFLDRRIHITCCLKKYGIPVRVTKHDSFCEIF